MRVTQQPVQIVARYRSHNLTLFVMRDVIEPILRGMEEDGLPYTGFLYASLMISADGSIKVLEYNCRFGDPETQPIMMRLKSDLVELCEAALAGELYKTSSEWDDRAALGVVLPAGGYPDAYQKGAVISGLPTQEYEDRKVFSCRYKASWRRYNYSWRTRFMRLCSGR